MGFLYSVVGFILAIGVLVVVHEFGHYWVAKTLGVKVLRFSVGFGKPLWTRRGGADNTEYVIAALPFGGYVKMLDETEGDVPQAEQHRAFNRQALPKRFAIVLAGPAFNFLFAILAYWLLFMIGIDGIRPVVGKVVENSIAEQAGFRVGDEWLTLDGKKVVSWDQYRLYLYDKALDRESIEIEVRTAEGNQETRRLEFAEVEPRAINASFIERGIGLYGYIPELPPVIGTVQAGSAAEAAGLRIGDRVIEIDGQAIERWEEAVTRIVAKPNEPLQVLVERDGRLAPLVITPAAVEEGGKLVGKIGAGVQAPEIPPEWRVKVRFNPAEALWRGVENTWSMSVLTLNMLYKMLLLEVSTENISGPITIAQYAGYSVQIGMDRFLMFLAVVSISLGVLNLLPIPILDGGHLLFYVAEAIKGRPLSEHAMAMAQRFGIMILLGLMLLAFYNDFVRLLQ